MEMIQAELISTELIVAEGGVDLQRVDLYEVHLRGPTWPLLYSQRDKLFRILI